ncbi:hypothetical protein [Microbacterium sp. R86528]|uniref:hypothetical protein n=1 Tax=Microbacterium sp. R86528 TaxID=3093864 RepID=UPI0037C90008
MTTLAVAVAWLAICFALVLGRSWTLLAGFAVLCGFAQMPLISLFESNAVQFIDDIPAAVLILVGVARLLSSRERRDHLALTVVAITLMVVAYAFVRSPDLVVGVAQARQVLLPFALAVAGFALRDMIHWRKLWNVVLVVAVLTAIWMIFEEIQQAPLVSPVWYYLETVGGTQVSMRNDLPPAYYADVAGGVVFRPGGPFMNPPVAGFILGAGAYAAMRNTLGFARISLLLIIAVALAFATARAGIVIFTVVTVVFLAWNKLGKFAAVIISGAFGGYALSIFIEQGNTASHTEGLLSGVMTALRAPLGVGFGVTGYQASLAGAEVGAGSESLLGLYFAWLGLPALLAVIAVAFGLIRGLTRVPRGESLDIWVAIAMITTAAVSESASSAASTTALWLAVGYALARCGKIAQPAPNDVRAKRGSLAAH